jgi:hypothetical protein
MSARTMTTIVAKCDGFGESDVETKRSSHRCCDLSDFNSVGQSSALMVVGKDEYLSFACESTKCRRMQNAISISFKTGS